MATKKPRKAAAEESQEPLSPLAQLLGLGLVLEVIGREFRSYKRGRDQGFRDGLQAHRMRDMARLEEEE